MQSIKKDKYKSARGGETKILNITCSACGTYICDYQKDGPGILRRMYFDRIIGFTPGVKELACPACKKGLGSRMVYAKENRDAYRLFPGSIVKKSARYI